jgi:citronellyl-CoA dehydrogenase
MKFTTEHRQLEDTVIKFCDKEINPHVAEWEKAEQFPSHELFKKLGDLGLLGLKYPRNSAVPASTSVTAW